MRLWHLDEIFILGYGDLVGRVVVLVFFLIDILPLNTAGYVNVDRLP